MLYQLFFFQHWENTGTLLVHSICLAENTSICLKFYNLFFEKQVFPTKYEPSIYSIWLWYWFPRLLIYLTGSLGRFTQKVASTYFQCWQNEIICSLEIVIAILNICMPSHTCIVYDHTAKENGMSFAKSIILYKCSYSSSKKVLLALLKPTVKFS